MVNMKPDDSVEEITRELRAQAARLWGEERAVELEASLQQTASQLWELGQVTPNRDLEPGFYQ
ncbi:MAG: hypothetical protein BZY87_06800 [SAR202 cluster bacterium Io17-Chloro-G6]|nr:MAG: hypothetical protein BZY87_06800 [SAR202 cluster bacterium Io17-Chloro-G6]